MQEILFSPNESISLLPRLGFAVLIGGVIGWNRQIAGKPAGLRTHMLVSLGAALIVMIPLQVSATHSADAVSRAIQGVATGVGFVGAGEILRSSNDEHSQPKIKGLTSAAAIWITAALGMAAGCGLVLTTVTGTLLVLLILTVVKKLENLGVAHRENGSHPK